MFPDKWSLVACLGLSVSMRTASMICFIFTWRWLFPNRLYQWQVCTSQPNKDGRGQAKPETWCILLKATEFLWLWKIPVSVSTRYCGDGKWSHLVLGKQSNLYFPGTLLLISYSDNAYMIFTKPLKCYLYRSFAKSSKDLQNVLPLWLEEVFFDRVWWLCSRKQSQ